MAAAVGRKRVFCPTTFRSNRVEEHRTSTSETDWMAQRVAQNPRFEVVQVEAESILFDNVTHDVVYLDPPAVIVWRLCDGERSVDEIARLIEQAYPQSRDSIASDVRQTVDALAKTGALTLLA